MHDILILRTQKIINHTRHYHSHMTRKLFAIATGFLFCLIAGTTLGLDWQDLDPTNENSALRKRFDSGTLMDAGEWGAVTFPTLAKEIWQINIHDGRKVPVPLSPYQKKWLGPWLTRWGIDPQKIQIIYQADLLDDHKILDLWPMAIMDDLAGQTFGNIIYLRQPHREKDGNLLVLLSHEIFHVKQYLELGSVAEFGRSYVKGYLAGYLIYEKNPMEVEAYDAQGQFRDWLCKQVGWSCE